MNEPRLLPNGYRHIAFSEVNSTNTTALEYSRASDPGRLWITAERQLQGKASRGRSWVSEPGNLYASLLLRINVTPDKLATLTFVASLALYETLAHFVPEDKLTLKWPNDVLLDGAKISGILLENHLLHKQDAAVIIGTGVNCQCNPDDTSYTATNIQATGISVEPHQVFQHLVVEMDNWLSVWNNGTNFTAIRRQWLERATGVGGDILVKMPNGQMCGIFEGIDRHGCLVLKTPDGVHHAISAADIFFSNDNEKSA